MTAVWVAWTQPRFFRSGRGRTWSAEMPEEIHPLFWLDYADAMELTGISRRSAVRIAA